MSEYLIWSHEHGGWWKPNRVGYTPDWMQAGSYSHDEALEICTNALNGWRPGRAFNEVPVALADVERMVAASWVNKP